MARSRAKPKRNAPEADAVAKPKKRKDTPPDEDEKASTSKNKKKNSSDNVPPDEAILASMMDRLVKRNSSSVSFADIMKARKMNDRNTAWRNMWKLLIDRGDIQPSKSKSDSDKESAPVFTSKYELTDQAVDRVATEEQKELKRLMESDVASTEEHHQRIRKICMNKRAVQVFDLLLKHGSYNRKELAATLGINDRGATFHYGLQQLMQLEFVVSDPSKKGNIVLSEKSFLLPEDRPEPIPLDPEELAVAMDKVYGKEMSKAQKSKLAKAEAKKVDKVEKDKTKAKNKKSKKPEAAEPDAEHVENSVEGAATGKEDGDDGA